jgi:hypothetical protein
VLNESPFEMALLLVLSALLLLALLGLPAWPYSSRWSYVPSGAFGFIALVIVILVAGGWL